MSEHNQLLGNYTRQCRNPPARLPVFCHNKAPQLHGKFYQETSSAEHRRQHVWTPWKAKDKGKNHIRNSLQVIPVISPQQLSLKIAAHRWRDLPDVPKHQHQTSKATLLAPTFTHAFRLHFLQLPIALGSESKSGVQNSVFWLSLIRFHPQHSRQYSPMRKQQYFPVWCGCS